MANEIDIRDVITRINKLTIKEKLHIFNILKNSDTDFSKNVNGYFFNLSHVEEKIIYKMINCLELIEKNRDKIKNLDKRREEMINYYKGMIEDKLKISLTERKNNYIKKLLLCESNHNIKLNINRKNKIKKRVWAWQCKQDPDEMIKEYNKMTKYDKDTVYYRLLTKSKTVSKNAGANRDTEENDEKNDIIYYDNDNDNDNVDDIYNDEFNDNENDTNIYEYDEFYKNDEEGEKITIDDNDNDNDNYEEMDDDKDKSNKNKTKYTNEIDELNDETTEYNISYYKKLLNKHGFKFDEYKNHRLYMEEYIK
jgi:hypothetical protein